MADGAWSYGAASEVSWRPFAGGFGNLDEIDVLVWFSGSCLLPTFFFLTPYSILWGFSITASPCRPPFSVELPFRFVLWLDYCWVLRFSSNGKVDGVVGPAWLPPRSLLGTSVWPWYLPNGLGWAGGRLVVLCWGGFWRYMDRGGGYFGVWWWVSGLVGQR